MSDLLISDSHGMNGLLAVYSPSKACVHERSSCDYPHVPVFPHFPHRVTPLRPAVLGSEHLRNMVSPPGIFLSPSPSLPNETGEIASLRKMLDDVQGLLAEEVLSHEDTKEKLMQMASDRQDECLTQVLDNASIEGDVQFPSSSSSFEGNASPNRLFSSPPPQFTQGNEGKGRTATLDTLPLIVLQELSTYLPWIERYEFLSMWQPERPELFATPLWHLAQSGSSDTLALSHYPRLPIARVLDVCPYVDSRIVRLDASGCATLTDAELGRLLSALPHLQSLSIDGCTTLTEHCLEQIGKYLGSRLRSFSVSFLPRWPVDQWEIFCDKCPNVVKLSSQGNVLSDRILCLMSDRWSQLKQLLVHSEYTVTNRTVVSLSNCNRRIRELRLNRTRVTDEALVLLGQRCFELEVLDVGNSELIRGNFIRVLLLSMPALRVLQLRNCWSLTPAAIKDWPRTQLVEISLRSCSSVDPQGLQDMCLSSALLQRLDLSGCRLLGDKECSVMSRHCMQLRHLHLDEWQQLTDKGLRSLAKRLCKLEYLSLVSCTNVTDRGVEVILQRCSSLQSLFLEGCHRLTDDAFVGTETFPPISQLNLDYCIKISDLGIQHLVRRAPLRTLSLRRLSRVTSQSVKGILEKNMFGFHVTDLDISMCYGLTDDIFPMLATSKSMRRLICRELTNVSPEAMYHFLVTSPSLEVCDATSSVFLSPDEKMSWNAAIAPCQFTC